MRFEFQNNQQQKQQDKKLQPSYLDKQIKNLQLFEVGYNQLYYNSQNLNRQIEALKIRQQTVLQDFKEQHKYYQNKIKDIQEQILAMNEQNKELQRQIKKEEDEIEYLLRQMNDLQRIQKEIPCDQIMIEKRTDECYNKYQQLVIQTQQLEFQIKQLSKKSNQIKITNMEISKQLQKQYHQKQQLQSNQSSSHSSFLAYQSSNQSLYHQIKSAHSYLSKLAQSKQSLIQSIQKQKQQLQRQYSRKQQLSCLMNNYSNNQFQQLIKQNQRIVKILKRNSCNLSAKAQIQKYHSQINQIERTIFKQQKVAAQLLNQLQKSQNLIQTTRTSSLLIQPHHTFNIQHIKKCLYHKIHQLQSL